MAIPGMELTTYEEVHILCLFLTLKDAMEFDQYVYERIEPIKNREDIFGRQIIRNEEDEVCQKVDKLLITRTSISCYELSNLIATFHGIIVPAHVDKMANSLISNLGFVPKELMFHSFEISKESKLKELERTQPNFRKLQCLYNSDAHDLGQIKEPLHKIVVTNRLNEDVINYLK